MPEDRVTITADASQYFDVLARAGVASDRLGASGARVGEGFVRGERAARVATANIVAGLATVNNAADATLIAFQSLERVFKIPIGFTVLAAGAIAAGVAISRAIDETVKLNEEVRKLASFSRIGGDFLNTGQITENLDAIGTKVQSLISDIRSRNSNPLLNLAQNIAGFLPGQSGTALAIGAARNFLNREDEERIAELRAGAARDVLFLTEKQNDLNAAELDEIDGLKDSADLRKAEADSKQRSYNLSKLIVAAGLEGTEAARQLLSTEQDRLKIETAILEKKKQQAQTQALNKTSDFFADVGSGRFAKAFAESQQHDLEAIQGQQLVDEIKRGQAEGFFQNPLSQAILRQAERIAQNAKTGLNALVNADFSNLLILSKYDFSGLAPLNNLTIQIQ